jgi:hypothetical protein
LVPHDLFDRFCTARGLVKGKRKKGEKKNTGKHRDIGAKALVEQFFNMTLAATLAGHPHQVLTVVTSKYAHWQNIGV